MNAEFCAKLAAAMRQMDNPKKDKTATVPTKSGGKYTYKYTQLDDVEAIVRPALLEQGLVLLQGVQDCGQYYNLVCAVSDGTCTLTLDSRRFSPTGDPQAQGSYETYMRRYQLLTAFSLAGEDDDGAAASPQSQARMANRQQPAQRKADPWQDLLGAYYAKCEQLALDPDATWQQMAKDIGFYPDGGMSEGQLSPARKWVSELRG